jgi:N utilization substance protein B
MPDVTRRHRARLVALQALYEEDFNPSPDPRKAAKLLRQRLRGEQLRAFAQQLIEGVRAHRVEIDERIARAAENWSLARMAATDRNALRLGVYEMLYAGTPPKVAIDEAVELANCFGTAQSGSFVNGILDRIMHESQLGKSATASAPRPAESATARPATDGGPQRPIAADSGGAIS